MRVVAVKLARARYAEAAAPVGVVHKDEFAAVSVRFFKGGELPRFWAEGLLICDCGGPIREQERKTKEKEKVFHGAVPLSISISEKWQESESGRQGRSGDR
jgi:hypothetical protein